MNNDILIAKFEGADVPDHATKNYSCLADYFTSKRRPEGGRFHTVTAMKYQTSWDWLMPVIYELRSQGMRIVLDNNYVTVADENETYVFNGCGILPAYEAVVHAIRMIKQLPYDV